ncbi:MMPL family transporter [Bailinhaonella thermotolerans]|uniref:MMPL family transporter n=1 Tax=Bailinhaonella thermotolerans TaxID=1070861 RepID=A0A3A4B7R4_9ACTN|nr:MMPL family transporter [Bailinhaonella thermotolerans]RJL33534.1 MMPL family transporter [Bailinhaonella thermotolerans]
MAGRRRRGPIGGLVRRRRLVLALAAIGLVVASLFGHDVHDRLIVGGANPEGAESERANAWLARHFGAGTPHLVLIARAGRPVDEPGVAAAGRGLAERLRRDPEVAQVTSYWTTPAPALRSRDGRAGLVLVRLHGDEAEVPSAAARVAPGVRGRQGPLTVSVTGEAQVKVEAERRSEQDLRRAELVAAPLTLLILLLVFGGLVAAALPVLMGLLAVTGTMAVLRVLTDLTLVSVFAMSIATALGFALAVDYSLFIVTRYREELARGRPPYDAIVTTMRTTGRAMLFSAATVVLSLSALLLFPVPTLRSIAYGGITVTLLAALSSLVVLPALLSVLGPRIDALRVPGRVITPRGPGIWGRTARVVMRRPLLVAVPLTVLLLALAAPFTQVKFGVFDDRLLPAAAPAAQTAQTLRQDFDAQATVGATMIALPALKGPHAATHLAAYASRLTGIEGVREVATATGTYPRPRPCEGGRRSRLHAVSTQGEPGAKPRPASAGRTAKALKAAKAAEPEKGPEKGPEKAEQAEQAAKPEETGKTATSEKAAKARDREERREAGSPGERGARAERAARAGAPEPGGGRGPRDGRAGDVAGCGPIASGWGGSRYIGAGGAWVSVTLDGEPYTAESGAVVERIRRTEAPGPLLVGGPSAQLVDTRDAIGDRLGAALGLVAVTTLGLILLLTGSPVLAVKALVLNALSLTVTFGVLVHIFQEGHLLWMVGDVAVSGTTDVLVPSLLFCVAFGLSLDYEVFLLSRITEEHRRVRDTTEAVALGLDRTGRLFTSAAVVFAVVMICLATSGLVLLKMVGVGLALAVLLDATLIRGLLVPAVMRLAGPANWWTPWPVARPRIPPAPAPAPVPARP